MLKKYIPLVRAYDCADYDPIDSWIFEDLSEVDFWLNISVGVEGHEATNNFQLHVVTQRTISMLEDKKYLLVIPYYSWDVVIKEINKILSTCIGVSWEGMCFDISKHFLWEYEGAERS
ncbi:hypothetical protein EYS14_23130 [Alteromonadaceae bacterium M269]|nr:hypothetical protein EYS14_23130 [Alteromonadaceae bacterium M269]